MYSRTKFEVVKKLKKLMTQHARASQYLSPEPSWYSVLLILSINMCIKDTHTNFGVDWRNCVDFFISKNVFF